MVGDFSVGKTSLIHRYVDGQFSDHYLSTIGVKISRKQIDLAVSLSQMSCQLMIWDIEGKTEFQSITPSYIAGVKGAIIVADLNRPETLRHIPEHLELIFSVNPGNPAVVVALNKSDSACEVNTQAIIDSVKLIRGYSVRQVYVTSAKTSKAVEEMFEDLARILLKNHAAQHFE